MKRLLAPSFLAFFLLSMSPALAASPCDIGPSGGTFSAGTYDCSGKSIGGPSAVITISGNSLVVVNNFVKVEAASITGGGSTDQSGASLTLNGGPVYVNTISLNGGGGHSATSCTASGGAGGGGSGGTLRITSSDVKIDAINSYGGGGGGGMVANQWPPGSCSAPGGNGGNGGRIYITSSSGIKSFSSGSTVMNVDGGGWGGGGNMNFNYCGGFVSGSGYGGPAGLVSLTGTGDVKFSASSKGGGGGGGYGCNPTYYGTPQVPMGSIYVSGASINVGGAKTASLGLYGSSSLTLNSLDVPSSLTVSTTGDFSYISPIATSAVTVSAKNITYIDLPGTGSTAVLSSTEGITANRISSTSTISLTAKKLKANSISITSSGGSIDLRNVPDLVTGSISGSGAAIKFRSGICINPPGCSGTISGSNSVTTEYDPSITTNVKVPKTKTLEFFGKANTKSGSPLADGSVRFTVVTPNSTVVWGPFSFDGLVDSGFFQHVVGSASTLTLLPGDDYKLKVEVSDRPTFTCSGTAVCETFEVSFVG